MISGSKSIQVTAYTNDVWEHACPVIRLSGPLARAGLSMVKGGSSGYSFDSEAESISSSAWVVIARDFPRQAENFQRVCTAARQAGAALIYETDDILTELAPGHPDHILYAKSKPDILRALQTADAVTVSTPALKEYAAQLNPHVILLPNYLNEEIWQVNSPLERAHDPNEPLVIGYFGSHTHLEDMEMIQAALIQTLKRYGERVKLRFWGLRPPAALAEFQAVDFAGLGMVSYADFAAYFRAQKVDIAIAPLQDTYFNHFKSGIKYLEYSAVAIPGIYSRVGSYTPLIDQGKNGFLASETGEWEEYLAQLIENPQLRAEMGQAALQNVRQNWLLGEHAQQWKDAYLAIRESSNASASAVSETPAGTVLQTRWYQEMVDLLDQERQDKRMLKQRLEAAIHHQEETISQLKETISQREETIFQKNRELEPLRVARRDLDAIISSPGWRMLGMVYSLRLVLIPRGSLRERILKTGLHSLHILRNEGIGSFLKKISQGQIKLPPPKAEDRMAVGVESGEPLHFPALSLIHLSDSNSKGLDLENARAWAKKQTFSNFEIISWNPASGTAVWPDGGTGLQIFTLTALLEKARGKYVAVLSEDLLQQGEAYLELNCIALETEGLAFTVNIQGNNTALLNRMATGQIPLLGDQPLGRMLVHRQALCDDFQIDLSAWRGRVAGKLLRHTGSGVDALPDVLERSVHLGENWRLMDSYFAGEWAQAGSAPLNHVLHPLETCLPAEPAGPGQPVILVVMPFLAVGGAERILLDGVHGLAGDARFVILTLEDHNPELGNMIEAFREETPYIYPVRDFLHPQLNPSFVFYLVERFKPVCLYVANGTSLIYDLAPELKKRYPAMRLANQVYDFTHGWINRYDPQLAATFDIHIGANARICEEYVRRGAPAKNTRQIESGVWTEDYDPARYSPGQILDLKKTFGLPTGKKIVTFIARLNPQKRPVDFLELARRCQGDADLFFLMVGDGPLGETVEENLARMKLKNLLRKPFYKPSSDIFAMTDILVLPSEFEGMPMVILEAQSMGKPVVATDVGNNRDVLEKNAGGEIVARIGDIEAMRQAVLRLSTNPPDPAAIRQSTIANFSVEKEVRLYREALLG